MDEVEEIIVLIEKMRKRLYDSARNKNLTDPEVTKASQELDNMLNEYAKLLQENVRRRS